VLLRSSFGDRLPDKAWLDYFPRAREVEQVMFPTLGETLEVLGAVGLRQVALVQVRERLAASLAAYVDRLRLRASSTFEHLTEAEIERGFAAIQAAADAETEPAPVEFDVDLLVLAADS
jgi:hypothetical protein